MVNNFEKAIDDHIAAQEAKVLMPTGLTAENGAKAALIGEFYSSYYINCETCL